MQQAEAEKLLLRRNGIMRIVRLDEKTRREVLGNLLSRNRTDYGAYEASVREIVEQVRTNGDEALFGNTEKFDHVKLTPDTVRVSDAEIGEAYSEVSQELLRVIRKALENIRAFHEKQKRNSWFDTREDGVLLGQKVLPLRRVGVYVPGGKAVYPSSVLMNIVPAKVAGVSQIVMVTPPGKDGKISPNTLVAAHEAGADVIFKVGGAQAVAALAYGTETVPRVDKIVGPGNIFVALAKKSVYGQVGIDSIAGPSEIVVLADETANARFVAADLLSQAEHDEMASAILVTTSMKLAEQVSGQVDGFLKVLSRAQIAGKSIENHGYILVVDSLKEGIETVDAIAPEHLEIVTSNPFDTMTRVHNAGAIFLGPYSSEPLGDYFAGPNHILPTGGTARFFSPLSVDDFVKKSSIVYYSEEALRKVHKDIETFAKAEQLTDGSGKSGCLGGMSWNSGVWFREEE